MREFATSPEALPKAPKLDDLPDPVGDLEPVAEVAVDDLPF
jgi:hypothetical protein